MLVVVSFPSFPVPSPNKLFENADINEMWHAFSAVLYLVLKYFTNIKVEK